MNPGKKLKLKNQIIQATFIARAESEIPPAHVINQYIESCESEFKRRSNLQRKELAEGLRKLRERSHRHFRRKLLEQSALLQTALLIKDRKRQRLQQAELQEKLLLTALSVCEVFLEKITGKDTNYLRKMLLAELKEAEDKDSIYLVVAQNDYLFIKEHLSLAKIDLDIRSNSEMQAGLCCLFKNDVQIEISWRKHFKDIKSWLLSNQSSLYVKE